MAVMGEEAQHTRDGVRGYVPPAMAGAGGSHMNSIAGYDHLISIFVVMVVLASAAWIGWRRWGSWRTSSAPHQSAAVSSETLAFEAFTHGNTCLAAGQFAEATASFERARELDPKRLHVADRLAEVARRQQAASATPPTATRA
jgi:cytochrome c-type biogenesis protein CcmH/NrfG